VTDAILVRHGATRWTGHRYCGRSDPWLTAEGRAAVLTLATDLAGVAPPRTRIVTSPARRARQTAAAIAHAVGGAVVVDERWRETDFGAAEGLTWQRLEGRYPDLAAELATGRLVDWPEGEPAADLERRVRAGWTDLVDRAEPVIVVSHGGPLRVIAAPRPAPDPATWLRIPLTSAR
jgi:ribonuclease H / adenosylcobalamin/alpha-ribazole phosphatase